jgi:hypothetical protein
VMLALDLGVFHRREHEVKMKEALIWSGIWVVVALLFNWGIYIFKGKELAMQFLAGYILERTLSFDNLFVFLLVFKPAILDLHERGGKQCPQLDDYDLFQEICLILLHVIKESRITATKVAGKIIGKVKNEVQRLLNDKASDALVDTTDFDFSLITATTDNTTEQSDDVTALLKALNISDTESLLDHLVQKRVITREAQKLLIATRIKGKSLKEICRPEDVSRLDKRRERAINDARRYIAKLLKL